MERIRDLYNLGIRFIKDDHNNNEKIGSTYYGECPFVGVRENALAAASFKDEIHRDIESRRRKIRA